MSQAVVTGNVAVILNLNPGWVFKSGTARFQLLPPSTVTKTLVSTLTKLKVPMLLDFDVNLDGSFQALVTSNDEISPAGTSYEVIYLVPNVSHVPRIYIFNGPGPFDLDLM